VQPNMMREAERLTLGVLMCGVVSLALSDYVSPAYWLAVIMTGVLRLFWAERFSLSEMQASLFGWVGFVWVGIELILGRDFLVACTDFMLILALAVTVESSTPRNHLHRLLVGMFLMLAAAVLTDSVLYILALTAFLFLTWRAGRRLYGLRQIGGDLPLGPHRTDLRVFAGMLFVTSLVFVSVPRIGLGPGTQDSQRYLDVTGFSDSISIGDFARELDDTVVMRVEPLVAEDQLQKAKYRLVRHYWRGTSLDDFNGHGWEKAKELPDTSLPEMMSYRGSTAGKLPIAVYREAVEHAYIFLPDHLAGFGALPQSARWMRQGSAKFDQAPQTRVRIPMWVGKKGTQWVINSPVLPNHSRPPASGLIASWAHGVTGNIREPKMQMRALMNEMLAWQYELNADIDPSRPVEHFLGQKKGHCELYASALALAARSLGIPARVVNGYRGGDWNDVGDFLVIRKKHAHSWIEAWVDGVWRRYDATPSMLWDLTASGPSIWMNNWEAVKMAWYRYVLEFTNEDRSFLWQSLLALVRDPDILLLLMPLFVFAGLGWRRFLSLLVRPDTQDLWPVVDKWLARHGVDRTAGVPLRHLKVPDHVNAMRWERFVSEWERQAYVGKPWNRWSLRRQLRALF